MITLPKPTADVASWTLSWVRNAPVVADRTAVMRVALAASRVDGLFCEFGVYTGDSLRFIADCVAPRTVHGFDSFQGLPKEDPKLSRSGWPVGAFRTPPPSAPPSNARLHVGWFEDTLPPFVRTTSGPAAFLHLDADLYSSTKTVLCHMASKIVRSTVLLFDEMLWWDGWAEKGEAKAWAEFVERTGIEFECLATAEGCEQVAVRIQ